MIDIIKKSMQIILLQTENACIVKKVYIVRLSFPNVLKDQKYASL